VGPAAEAVAGGFPEEAGWGTPASMASWAALSAALSAVAGCRFRRSVRRFS